MFRNQVILVILLAVLLPLLAVAQETDVSAMEARLQKLPSDTSRISLLNDLAFELIGLDDQKAEAYLREALSLCNKDKSLGEVGKLNFPKGEATSLNVLGVLLDSNGRPNEAIFYFQKALAIRQRLEDTKGVASVLNNIAGAYESLNLTDSAVYYAKRNLEMSKTTNDPARIARATYGLASKYEDIRAYNLAYKLGLDFLKYAKSIKDPAYLAQANSLLGGVMLERSVLVEAQRYYKEAVEYRKQTGDTVLIGQELRNYANVVGDQDSFELAINLYKEALAMHTALSDSVEMSQDWYGMAESYKAWKRPEEALKYLDLAEPFFELLGDKERLMLLYETKGDVLFDLNRDREAEKYIRKYVPLAEELKDTKFLIKSYKDLSKILYRRKDYKGAYEMRKKYADQMDQFHEEKESRFFADEKAKQEDEEKQAEINTQKIFLAQKEAELATAEKNRTILIGAAGLISLLAMFAFYRSQSRKRANTALSAKNKEIEAEKQRADDLLANILPEATAQELKANQKVKPVRYDAVSVLFTDFKSFTTIAATLAPEVLVAELDRCFRLFDQIVSRHGIEKIKTIGDAYMCACGLPIPSDHHATRVVLAALEMQDELKEMMEENKKSGRPVFEMRVGIHTGPVVAGVVGSRKFAYDIWGDAVNTAARMEQSGEPGKVNISEATWLLVKDQFVCSARGRISAKNIGDIEMYFVERQK